MKHGTPSQANRANGESAGFPLCNSRLPAESACSSGHPLARRPRSARWLIPISFAQALDVLGTAAVGYQSHRYIPGFSCRDGKASLDAPRSQVPVFPRQD